MARSSQLQQKLRQALGEEAAEDLVRWMKEIDDRRGDIAELRHETQLGFARVDTRFEKLEGRIDTLEAKMAALMHQGLREQTRFFFLAWSVLLAVIVGLYAR